MVIDSSMCHITRTPQDGHWFFHVSHHSHGTRWSLVLLCVTSLARLQMVIGSSVYHITRTAQDGHWFFRVSHDSHATTWSLVLPCVTSLARHKMVIGSSVYHITRTPQDKSIGHIAGNCWLTNGHSFEFNKWSGYVGG